MNKKRILAVLLALTMLTALFSGCGASSDSSTKTEETAKVSASTAPAASKTPETSTVEQADASAADSAEDSTVAAESGDFTKDNENRDFTGYKEMLKGLTTTLPVTDEDTTLTYFLGFESNTLNYLDGGQLQNQQIWKWVNENTGVNIDLKVVDKTSETDKFNLMVASGDYTDIIPAADYTAGVESSYDEDVTIDLGDYLETDMPNYWKIINSDQNLLTKVKDSDKFLAIYAVKDQVANPSGTGTFIRQDWLDDLNLEVPQTYDELTKVLEAFKTEKGATEPMSLFNTISMANGLLMGGFGSMAELSTNGMGSNALNGYYQVDGKVVYGATADGTRKYLSWLHQLYSENLINFENMQNRETNPFSDLNATAAANGSTGYIFSNQPFGGNYSTMASQNGDTKCNWWPVQDVAETAGQTIPFYEEVSLVDMTSLAITSQCENVDTALKFLDYGYSYEGSLLYNFGFQKGSGHDVETWDYNDKGEPTFDKDVMNGIAATNIASSIVSTKDLAGVVFDTRLSFEFGDRELACYDAWSTNKTTDEILGSDVQLTAEEGVDASAIYSDILTYVATSALQFINGDLDVDDDAVWSDYVSKISGMNIDGLTEIVQGAYDRVNP